MATKIQLEKVIETARTRIGNLEVEVKDLKHSNNKISMDYNAKELVHIVTIGELRDRVHELENQAEFERNSSNQEVAETNARLNIMKQVLDDTINRRNF
jgi:hypothetical protein